MENNKILEDKIISLEKELEIIKKKLYDKEEDERVKEWYEMQKGKGGPPMPHW